MFNAGTVFVDVLPRTSGFSAALTGQMKGLAPRMAAIGSGLTKGLTLPIVAAAGASAKLALDFETAFTKIGALSNTNQTQLRAWREEVLKMAGDTARAPQELAEALFFLASAGLDASQVMPTLEASAQAAAIGMGDTQDIARLLANTLNAYAGSGLKAAEVTDILAAAIKAGSAEPDEFANAMGRILPIASKAGIEFDQVAASLAQLSNVGLDVNEGTTAIRAAILSLLSPSVQAKETLHEFGLTADEVRRSMSEGGIIETFRLLEEATNGDIDALRKIIGNVRGLAGVFGLTEQEAKKVDQTFRDVADSTGALDEGLKKTRKGSAFQLQQAFARLQVLAIQIGEDLLPAIVGVVEQIGRLAESFGNLSPTTQGAIIKLALFVAAIGPILSITGKLIPLIKALSGAFRGLAGASGAAAGAKAAGGIAGVGGAASTLGPILVGAAGFIGAVALAMRQVRNVARDTEAVFARQGRTTEAGSRAFEDYVHNLKSAAITSGDMTGAAALEADAVSHLNRIRRRYVETVQQSKVGQRTYNRAIANGASFLDALAQAEGAVTRYREASSAQLARLAEATQFSTRLNRAQRGSIEELIGRVGALHGRLTDQEAANLRAAAAAGRHKEAVDILKGAIDRLKDKKVRIDVEADSAYDMVTTLDYRLRNLPTHIQTYIETIEIGTGHPTAGRAAGGPVTKKRVYMVGEKGPELFIPKESGRIIANKDLRVPKMRAGYLSGEGGGREREATRTGGKLQGSMTITNWETGEAYFQGLIVEEMREESLYQGSRARAYR